MKTILNLVAAFCFVVAIAFGFLIASGPPVRAAEKQNVSQAFYQPECSGDAVMSIEFSFAECAIEREAETADIYLFAALRNHALRAGAGNTLKVSVGLAPNPKNGFPGNFSNYKSPPTDFEIFTGFDNPARGKI